MNLPSRNPGRYPVLISGTSVEQIGANGNWCVVVHARTVDTNEDVKALIWLTEKAMKIARQQLKALNFDVDRRDIGELHESSLLVGREVEFLAKLDEYRGAVKIKWEVPTPKPDLKGLTAQLRAAGSEESRARAAQSEDAPAPRLPGEGVREAAAQARADAAANPTPPAKPAGFKGPPPNRAPQGRQDSVGNPESDWDIPFAWFLPLLALFN